MSENTGYPNYLSLKINAHVKRINQDGHGKHLMRGRIPGENSIQLISNDYLSLAKHPAIVNAQHEALNDANNYLLMSIIFLRGDNPQSDFEQRMADHLLADEAVLCQSGYNANIGLIQTIVEDTQVPVYIDMLAHMSLWDGARLAGAPIHPFRHNNIDHLLSLINRYGPGLVIVDSVYSTNGSVCPLQDLVVSAHACGCLLLVDESHSLGTHGPQGRGLVVELGLQDKVMFRTASLAKAFAGRAGIITCPAGFSDYFKCTSKPSIFSSALLPNEIAGLHKTLDLIIAADDLRERLRHNANYLRTALRQLGYNVDDSQAQIISLEPGTEWQTIVLRDALEKRGVFGSVFCAPATPKNRALIRFSINAGLTERQLRYVSKVCEEIREEVEMGQWKSTRRLAATSQKKLVSL